MAKCRLLDEESVQAMLDMRNIEGLSNEKISARMGVSVATVYNYIGAAGPLKYVPRNKLHETVEDPVFSGILQSTRVERYISSKHWKTVLANGRLLYIIMMTEDGDRPIMTGLSRNDVETLVEELKSILTLMKE